MVDRASGPLHHLRATYQWPVVWGLGLLAVVLGCVGFLAYGTAHNEPITGIDALYLTLQLFILHTVKLTHPIPWELNVARFLAPAVLGITAVLGFLALFREHLQALRLRFRRDHVVVCGLGPVGIQLVRDARANNDRVVVIDHDPQNDRIATAVRMGATVVGGDATDDGVLLRAGAHKAKHVVAVMGSDAANVQIASRMAVLVRNNRPAPQGPLTCFIYVNEPVLRWHLHRDRSAFPTCSGRLAVTVVGLDEFENGARLLFQREALDYRPITRRDDPRRAHLVAVHFGQMGEAVLLQAIRIAHFANGTKLRATVVHPSAERLKADLLQRYAFLDEVCDIVWCPWEGDDPTHLDELAALCQEQDSLATYALCFDDDARNLRTALRLLPLVKDCAAPILMRTSSRSGLASILLDEAETTSLSPRLRPFGMVEDVFSREMLLHEQIDAIARRIHEDFVKRRKEEGQTEKENPALRDWGDLHEDFKDSNRQQADHLPVKMRAIGCHVAPRRADGTPCVKKFSDEEIELLAEMEHARWVVERKLAGWTYAPGPKNVLNKTSPYLVAWGDLPKEIQDFDRQAVALIPDIVRESGLKIYR